MQVASTLVQVQVAKGKVPAPVLEAKVQLPVPKYVLKYSSSPSAQYCLSGSGLLRKPDVNIMMMNSLNGAVMADYSNKFDKLYELQTCYSHGAPQVLLSDKLRKQKVREKGHCPSLCAFGTQLS